MYAILLQIKTFKTIFSPETLRYTMRAFSGQGEIPYWWYMFT
ncbi:unknown [[Mannheimia] succiniciproducens MBEL55E]|uniref:Uncharacterized protein n=1 Tax=Mannheimia succiniciproducens (strain KCTC 0769BP / MBEL55E) TaxID=221988 RepID=Q65W82_MANSM|nr:unknown [[Mannheimia] succiniciproducens MBEL55E]